MTIPRMLLLLVSLSTIGIAAVAIRVEEGRVLRRIQEYRSQEEQAQREIKEQNALLGGLRSPLTIRERVNEIVPSLGAGSGGKGAGGAGAGAGAKGSSSASSPTGARGTRPSGRSAPGQMGR